MCLYLIYKISMCNKIKLLYTKMISENAWRVLTCRCTIAQQDTHIQHMYMYVCACYVSSGVVVAAALDINAYMFVNKNKYFNNSLPPLVVDTHATTTEIPPAVFTDSVTNIYEASTGCIPAVNAYDSFLFFIFFQYSFYFTTLSLNRGASLRAYFCHYYVCVGAPCNNSSESLACRHFPSIIF